MEDRNTGSGGYVEGLWENPKKLFIWLLSKMKGS